MPGMLITCRITDSVLFFMATLHRSAKTPQCSVTFNLRSTIIPNFTSISCILSLCLLCIHPNSNPTLIISCCTNPLAAMPWTWPIFKETSIQLQPDVNLSGQVSDDLLISPPLLCNQISKGYSVIPPSLYSTTTPPPPHTYLTYNHSFVLYYPVCHSTAHLSSFCVSVVPLRNCLLMDIACAPSLHSFKSRPKFFQFYLTACLFHYSFIAEVLLYPCSALFVNCPCTLILYF